jgi:hypothetical protein
MIATHQGEHIVNSLFGQIPLFGDAADVRVPLPEGLDDWSLAHAREHLRERVENGIKCPCCGQFAKVYRRKLNSGMAASLLWLVKTFEKTQTWVEVQKKAPRYVMANREMGKLVHWGLVELQENLDDPKRKTIGLWRPTGTGVDFIYGRLVVPCRVYLYDNTVVGFDSKRIGIREALETKNNKFDYDELMRS